MFSLETIHKASMKGFIVSLFTLSIFDSTSFILTKRGVEKVYGLYTLPRLPVHPKRQSTAYYMPKTSIHIRVAEA